MKTTIKSEIINGFKLYNDNHDSETIEMFVDNYICQKYIKTGDTTKEEIISELKTYFRRYEEMFNKLSQVPDDDIFARIPDFADKYFPKYQMIQKLEDNDVHIKNLNDISEYDVINLCYNKLNMTNEDIRNVSLEHCIQQMATLGITKTMLADKIRVYLIDNELISDINGL